jgi:hypothetical protein
VDSSEAAAAELGRRARRLRGTVGGALAFVGLFVGGTAYVVLRSFFLERFGMSSPVAVATLTVLPSLFLALRLARPVTVGLLEARRTRWVDDLAARHGIAREHVEELASVLDLRSPRSGGRD